MSNTNPSANMNLPIPVAGVDPGPDYALNVNNALTIVDGHNHAPGSGVPVTPAGLSISSDLSFLGNNATVLRSVRFSAQGSPLGGASDLGCLYESGVDLYYNDGNGNQIQITSGGSVAGSTGTITGLPSGTAGAAFSAGTFIFTSATNTGADIKGASFLLTNNVASSHVLTLAPPNAMGADFQITLPSLPGVTNLLSMDTSGNIAAAINVDNSTIDINTNTIEVKAGGINTTQLANGAVTQAKRAALGQQVSSSSGPFSTPSGSYVDVTNLSVTIVTTGRPVFVGLVSDGSGFSSYLGANTSTGSGSLSAQFSIVRDSTSIADSITNGPNGNTNAAAEVPPSSLWIIDTGASAASHTYKVQAKLLAGTTALVGFAKLIAYEL